VSDAPFVNFYTSDFLAGTSGLTASTKGIYITLLCLMYEAEAPLSQSWETLARRCGCTLPAFQKAIETLQDDGKVVVSDAGLWSPKCEKHITLRRERQSSAKAAAEKRWGKDKQNQRAADASAMPKQCKPKPEPDIREAKASLPRKRGTRLPDNWVLPREWGQWAVIEGWAETVIRSEADKFRDYWIGRSGKDATKADWQATWRNWMRNSKAPKIVEGGGYERTAKGTERLRAFIGGAD
jgi:uncharacterized protein YdaU (DUF1376 family)